MTFFQFVFHISCISIQTSKVVIPLFSFFFSFPGGFSALLSGRALSTSLLVFSVCAWQHSYFSVWDGLSCFRCYCLLTEKLQLLLSSASCPPHPLQTLVSAPALALSRRGWAEPSSQLVPPPSPQRSAHSQLSQGLAEWERFSNSSDDPGSRQALWLLGYWIRSARGHLCHLQLLSLSNCQFCTS